MKILLIDDEESIQELTSHLLVFLGNCISVADSSDKAIALFETALNEKHPFDIVIFDLYLPGNLHGVALFRQLTNIYQNFKSIISSGYSENPELVEFRKFGFDGVLVKPYKLSDLKKVLESLNR